MKMKLRTTALAAVLVVLSGCATNGSMSPEGQLALETSVRIAVRHSLDSPRAIEKARNIRSMGERLQEALRADVTVATLTAELDAEIDELGLDPLSTADAHDLLRLLSALIEQRVGTGDLKPEGVVKVSEFVDMVLAALPVV